MRENTDALRWVEFSLVYWEEQETLEQDNVFPSVLASVLRMFSSRLENVLCEFYKK